MTKKIVSLIILVILACCSSCPYQAQATSINYAEDVKITEVGVKNYKGVLRQLEQGAVDVYIKGSAESKTDVYLGVTLYRKATDETELIKMSTVELDREETEHKISITIPKNPHYYAIKIFVMGKKLQPHRVPVLMTKSLFSSIFTKDYSVRNILDDDVVFMETNNSGYYGGEKKRASIKMYKDNSGTLLVESKKIADAFSLSHSLSGNTLCLGDNILVVSGEKNCTFDGEEIMLSSAPQIKNGIFYIPVADFCRSVLGKYVYEDARGFVLISDIQRNYSDINDPQYSTHFQSSDEIFRYMHYDRPSGDDLISAMKEKGTYGTHPRMIALKDELLSLKDKRMKNDYNKLVYDSFLKNCCDSELDKAVYQYNKPDGLRLFAAFNAAGERIENLGIAYQLTGEEKYAKRAWEEIENVISWPDFNCKNHFLDSGMGLPGVMVGYDCIYDYLTKEKRTLFKERINTLYFDYCIDALEGTISSGLQSNCITSNWGAVCGYGMLSSALCLIDAEDEESEFTQKCKFIASEAMRLLEFQFGNLFPSGTSYEGPGYWEYIFSKLTMSIDLTKRLCGSDYNFLSSPGYDKSVMYPLYTQAAIGIWAYSESIRDDYFPETLFLYAKITNDENLSNALNAKKAQMNKWHYIKYLMWNITDIYAEFPQYPLDWHEENEDLIVMRSSWDKNSMLFGMIGGENSAGKSHYDVGSFILEWDETEWFMDLGKDNYNLSEGDYWEYQTQLKLYRKRVEGHNLIEINPSPSDFGQIEGAKAHLEKFVSDESGALAVYDLSDLYSNEVEVYKRGFFMCDNRNGAIVQDELVLKDESILYWFAHTDAEVEILSDLKTAILTKNGKKLKAEFFANLPSWRLGVMDAEPLSDETKVLGEFDRSGIRKLCVKNESASGKVNISVKFTLISDDKEDKPLSFKNISNWEL